MKRTGQAHDRPALRAIPLDGPRFAALAADLLHAGYALRFRARGSSMWPWIRDGDLLEVWPAAPLVIRRGDVVLCRTAGQRMVVHRVIGVDHEDSRTLLRTRGDALACADAPLAPDQVLGRVVTVERQGRRARIDTGPSLVLGRLWVRLAPLGRRLFCTLGVPHKGTHGFLDRAE